jgi:aspartyl-tRNA(Asn)/glutamyl-tRNA(Gln) amidotransferase subunit B
VPLVEIVSEPDIHSPDEARAYGTELQRIVRALGVSDARLEEGSMRFDANVSVRPAGSDTLGTRAEVKNMNSLRSLQRAVAYEIDRQVKLIEDGGEVVQETRHWHEDQGVTTSMRSKEESEDYRYFQEPDLLPLFIDAAWREAVRERRPELPAEKRSRYLALGADAVTAALLIDDDDLGSLFADAVAIGADARTVGIWLTGDVVAYQRTTEIPIASTALTAGHLAELSAMTAEGSLSATAAKEVLRAVLDGEGSPRRIAEARDLVQVSDVSEIEGVVDEILAEHEDAVAKVRDGDDKPIGFLVGQVMRATGGKADPSVVQELVRAKASG